MRPKIRKHLPPGTSAHAQLAADLALDKPSTSKHAPWSAVMPSRESLALAQPLCWDPALQAYLPPAARALLRAQQARFARDWAAVRDHLLPALAPSSYSSSLLTFDRFRHAWLLVSTRTFYYQGGGGGAAAAAATRREDRLALQPVADLFNHDADADADAGAGAADCRGVGVGVGVIAAGRAYAPGDEVHICYGRHHSDLLLAEYGFVPAANRWDEALLDDALAGEFTDGQRDVLDAQGFWGRYVLDARTVCYRTQVAVRLLCVRDVEVWRRWVIEGEDGGEEVQRRVDAMLARMLRRYLGKVEGTIEELGRVDVGEPCQREVLSLRWKQISGLIRQTIERLEG